MVAEEIFISSSSKFSTIRVYELQRLIINHRIYPTRIVLTTEMLHEYEKECSCTYYLLDREKQSCEHSEIKDLCGNITL